MKQRTDMIQSPVAIQTGIEAWLNQSIAFHDAVIVSSSALKRGFAAPASLNDSSVERTDDPIDAVLNASGRSWGGQRTALVLEGRGIPEAISTLSSMQEAGRALAVTLWPQAADLSRIIRGVLDAELTLLAANSMQETLDLSAAASHIASASGRPCIVLGSSREGAWSMGRFEVVEAPALIPTASTGTDSNGIDPFRPAGIGLPLSGRMHLKQQASRLATTPDLDVLIEDALEAVSGLTGRPLSAFSGPFSSLVRLAVPANLAPPASMAERCLQLTQLFPLPHTLEYSKPADLRPAVLLPAGAGSDSRHPLVRAFDSIHGSRERRSGGIFRRHAQETIVRAPLTVLVDPEIRWSGAHVEAITKALDETDAASDLRFLDARLSAETRVPAIEEAVHTARSAGFDPSLLDLPIDLQRGEEPSFLIGARHPHTALALSSRILERADAGAVAAPISMDSGGEALVFIRVTGMPVRGHRSRVLLPDSHVLGHRTLRHHIPESADILVPDSTRGSLPRWMSEMSRSVFIVASETDWLDGAFDTIPTEASVSIQAGTEDDLLDARALAPEERHPALDTSTSRDRFLRTLGHLQDMDRLDEAPADEWIMSGRTPAFVPRPNRWLNDARPIPTVIGDKCTGCSACWSVCPEAAITTRAFSLADLMNAVSDAATRPFVHLPRLMSAWVSTTHSVLKKDELGQFRNAADLLGESLDRLLESAGVAEDKATAIRKEAASVIEQVHHQELIQTELWFDSREKEAAGSGWSLALQVDPTVCTHCSLCSEACPESAIEDRVDTTTGEAFRQLDTLPAFSPERLVASISGQSGSLLTGSSSSASFRSGSSDRANMTRTVIRLAVESEAAAMRQRSTKIVEAVQQGLNALESAIQKTAQDRIRINDFDSFGRQLDSAAGDVSEVLQNLLGAPSDSVDASLSNLATVRKRLSRIGADLNMAGTTGPALTIVNSLVSRSDGLSPFPSNPFAASMVNLPPEQAISIIPGLIGAWRHRLEETALTLRQARQLIDGTFDPDSAVSPTAEDQSWAQAHLPRILWIVDRCDQGILAPLVTGLPIHLCWVDGGPTLESVQTLRPTQVQMLLPGLSVHSTHAADSVGLLATLEDMSLEEQAVLHAFAPDPARDGIETTQLTDVIETAGAAGLFGESTPHTSTLADWMARQDRFRSRFKFVPRTDWSSDQVPVLEWLGYDDKERVRAEPCVIVGSGKAEQRWIPDGNVLQQSEKWWRTMVHSITEEEPLQEVTRLQETPQEPATLPETTPDVHTRLTERLLALSGFQSGGTSLKAWLDMQNESVSPERESGAETE